MSLHAIKSMAGEAPSSKMFPVNVNLSSKEFSQPDLLVEAGGSSAGRRRSPPKNLKLEITEREF